LSVVKCGTFAVTGDVFVEEYSATACLACSYPEAEDKFSHNGCVGTRGHDKQPQLHTTQLGKPEAARFAI